MVFRVLQLGKPTLNDDPCFSLDSRLQETDQLLFRKLVMRRRSLIDVLVPVFVGGVLEVLRGSSDSSSLGILLAEWLEVQFLNQTLAYSENVVILQEEKHKLGDLFGGFEIWLGLDSLYCLVVSAECLVCGHDISDRKTLSFNIEF